MTATVLLVEDERKLRELVRSYLERAGFSVLSTESGAEAISVAETASPDLIVLDLGLPDVPGEAVAREVRATSSTPILMLTAKTSEEDRIAGLELGADDYVTKPFSPRELVLRVQAILRRNAPPTNEQGISSFGDGVLLIDEPRRVASVRGREVELTPPSGAFWSPSPPSLAGSIRASSSSTGSAATTSKATNAPSTRT